VPKENTVCNLVFLLRRGSSLAQDEDILLIRTIIGVVQSLKKHLERTYHSPLK
jgi:hypothetical protein